MKMRIIAMVGLGHVGRVGHGITWTIPSALITMLCLHFSDSVFRGTTNRPGRTVQDYNLRLFSWHLLMSFMVFYELRDISLLTM